MRVDSLVVTKFEGNIRSVLSIPRHYTEAAETRSPMDPSSSNCFASSSSLGICALAAVGQRVAEENKIWLKEGNIGHFCSLHPCDLFSLPY